MSWADTEKNEVLREMIQHENTLRDNRLGYVLTLNGFLFAALAFAWTSDIGSVGLVVLLAALGTIAGFSGIAAQETSTLAIRKLRSQAEGPDPLVAGLTSGETPEWVRGLAPWRALPVMLLAVWPLLAEVRVAIWIVTGS